MNWTSTAGDPESFNIDIINLDNAALNDASSIASVRQQLEKVFVNSSTFSVKPAGSTPAPPVSSVAASSVGSSGSATSSSLGSSTISGSAASTSSISNGASTLLTPKSAVVGAGIMAIAALVI
ncbi:hypothetical protein F5878DRAFT_729207 [Lentinula raphanica]|uniref:Uncharacterized protein n=1 Tax=Lentinula raphanica TaxID=153919 RepID=A0AA38NXZ7_9AGAR|nr:hypothetical protein F5878DRAFT_729207 [Lentinula raphanica]